MPSYNSFLQKAIIAAMEAGSEIISVYDGPHEIEIKEDKSPLTIADRKAHQKIIEHLKQTLLPVLSEEGKSIPYEERKNWDLFWMVDPLDGTKEFIKRNGEFTVNIALIENNKPVLGVIYAPVPDILYFGSTWVPGIIKHHAKEFYTQHDGDDQLLEKITAAGIRMPLTKENDRYVIVASRSHLTAETEEFINTKKSNHGDLQFISKGSSLKICLVAEGTADVYPRLAPTMEWDTAAGQAIAESAGCTVTNYETNSEMVYNKENLLNPFFVVERIK
ncbi:MAG TPA: 3'(2'),5'-bisphosphate nucleotidase CysQ [Bacteroidia bacterium]|nr:3'(2'),5'-bisphosphate nucleotidase CysQ [Bacteroidia bacterium]